MGERNQRTERALNPYFFLFIIVCLAAFVTVSAFGIYEYRADRKFVSCIEELSSNYCDSLGFIPLDVSIKYPSVFCGMPFIQYHDDLARHYFNESQIKQCWKDSGTLTPKGRD